MDDLTKLSVMARLLRRDSMMMTTKAGSGHPTTCMSCAEIMSSLFFQVMRYDPNNSNNPDNDEFILSKGHAAPILYACLHRAGCSKEDPMTLRQLGSPYEGHPVPSSLPWVKVATGSLGQGLSVATGMAIAAKIQQRNYRVYALLGDSECAEGSVYEAIALACHRKLDNLTAIVDVNRLGQSGETMFGHDINHYERIFSAFGAHVIVTDGHDLHALLAAFAEAASTKEKPTVILAHTFKGRGVSFTENKEGWHGKPLNEAQLADALKELPDAPQPSFAPRMPASVAVALQEKSLAPLSYKRGELIATREAYGNALVRLGAAYSTIAVADAEVKNSTFAEKFLKVQPNHFVETYIAEQNMVGIVLGLSKKGFHAFGSTFAAFLTRAHDQIRMATLSSANLTLVGSHAGVSIGEDGASQMALEDLAMFRCLPDSMVFYPSDAVSTEKIMEQCLTLQGVKYIRTSRPKTPVLYESDEEFLPEEFKVVKYEEQSQVVLVGCGVTLHEAIKASEQLAGDGIRVTVVDCYCIKPFPVDEFKALVQECGGCVVVAEDHYPEGGLGEAVATALENTLFQMKHLAVRKMPHSGKSEELLRVQEIDAAAIVQAVKALVAC
ncbi:transketolase [Candidatus Woesearchaeota archaeon]|nr:transketolase [Candidatus Woesearchaeota archaeon]